MGQFGANVVQRKDLQPIYILLAEDLTTKDGIQYYKLTGLPNEQTSVVEISGILLTKTQAGKLTSNPYSDDVKEPTYVNRKIPWSKVIRIDNINYKKQKPQGE